MKDPKAIRKAIMTARNIAAMVDPNFARVPLPQVGEPDYEEMRPPLQFSMGGRLPAQRSDNPFEQFQPQDPFSFDLPDHTYAAGGEVYGDNSKIKVVGNYEGEHRLVPISPKNTNYQHVMEYVPIDWLMEHRGNEYRHSPERMEQLRNEIQEEGLREPVLISTGKNSRTSIVGEGNHRVLAAKQLGYTHIPVRAMVGSSAGSDRFPEGAHDEDIIPEPNRYFPSDAKPSRVMRSLGYEGQPELPEDWWEKGYAAGGEVDDEQEITGYHGSANEFPEFSMTARNRGQGQSAFGEGHNFAEDEDVARRYRDMTAREHAQGDVVHKYTGEALPDDAPEAKLFKAAIRYGERDLPRYIKSNWPSRIEYAEKALKELDQQRAEINDDEWVDEQIKKHSDDISALERAIEIGGTHRFVPSGHMYEAGLRVNPGKLLKWHEPVDAQPEELQRHLIENGIDHKPDWTGKDIYSRLTEHPDNTPEYSSKNKYSKELANQILSGIGIHGIQWKDTDSQIAPGRGKNNYTIWDDSRIKTRRRYAMGGMPDDEQPADGRELNDFGLYSHAAEQAAGLQRTDTPENYKEMLLKLGVKPAEIEYSGYDKAFAGQPQVTREQVAEHFQDNIPELFETQYGDDPFPARRQEMLNRHNREYSDYVNDQRANGSGNYFEKPEYREMVDRHYAEKKEIGLQPFEGDPHHKSFTVPGGENYREILLKHNDDYDFGGVGNHFGGDPNIAVSLRLKDRRDEDGSILHLEELQSDWGQKARKHGFADNNRISDTLSKFNDAKAAVTAAAESQDPDRIAAALKAQKEASDAYHNARSAVERAPYIDKTDNWVDLGLKRALIEAAQGGHDKLAWTPGDIQADRYSLSKHIKELHHKSNDDGTYNIFAQGRAGRGHLSHLDEKNVPEDKLADFLGKEVAEKIIARHGDESELAKNPGDNWRKLSGLSLDVGGEGMAKFYNQMLPKRLMRLARMHDPDAKMDNTVIRNPRTADYGSQTTRLPFLHITPKMRESILKNGFAAHADGGRVEGYAGGGDVEAYQDPETQYISDWNWRPVEDVQESLGGLREIPSHVEKFGDFMDNIAQRAAGSGLTPRDLIKAYTITRSSIQRQAADVNKLRASGLDLPEEMTGKIRPEGAFGEWLHTPAGQAYLDAAEKGKVHQTAIQDAIKVMAPFGRHQTDIPDALTWAALNLPGKEKQVSELVHAGHLMASTPEEWRAFTQHIRGVGPSKSGFLASLMGRGDQPTLDARQIILHTGRPTKEASKYIAKKGGAGGIEAVDRLAARQSAMDLSLPDRLKPYYQHLAHHAVWDKAGNDETTHEDVVRAMHHAANGGAQVDDEGEGILSHPVAKIFQTIGMAGLNDPSVDPEKFKEYLQRAQNALARKITTKGSDVLASYPGAANVKMSKFGKPLEEMESTAIQKGFMLPRKEADIEEMQRRKARIFPFLGDLSPADQILLKSGQTSLINPSEQQGGSDFMRSEFAKGSDPAAYGNRIGAAKTLAKKIASQTPEGTPAIGTHVAMGLGSVDSSHHAYEPILRMIPNSPIAQKHIDEFDAMMHEALPPTKKYPMAWPGIMNTEEAEQFFAGRPGTHASFFAKKIDSSKWQKAGFPDIGEVRFSASTPELLGAPRLSTGHAFSQVEPSGRVITKPDLKHKTYPALIPSEGEGYLGGSSTPIPAKLMFSDFYKTMKTKDKSGKEIDYDSPAGQTLFQQSLMTKVPYQDATQEWLDNIMEDRRQKQERGFKKGGKVRGALMIAKGLKKR